MCRMYKKLTIPTRKVERRTSCEQRQILTSLFINVKNQHSFDINIRRVTSRCMPERRTCNSNGHACTQIKCAMPCLCLSLWLGSFIPPKLALLACCCCSMTKIIHRISYTTFEYVLLGNANSIRTPRRFFYFEYIDMQERKKEKKCPTLVCADQIGAVYGCCITDWFVLTFYYYSKGIFFLFLSNLACRFFFIFELFNIADFLSNPFK